MAMGHKPETSPHFQFPVADASDELRRFPVADENMRGYFRTQAARYPGG